MARVALVILPVSRVSVTSISLIALALRGGGEGILIITIDALTPRYFVVISTLISRRAGARRCRVPRT